MDSTTLRGREPLSVHAFDVDRATQIRVMAVLIRFDALDLAPMLLEPLTAALPMAGLRGKRSRPREVSYPSDTVRP